jgi:hypothetical protein
MKNRDFTKAQLLDFRHFRKKKSHPKYSSGIFL